jgi:carbon-monoxide dehydrogenase large subunit
MKNGLGRKEDRRLLCGRGRFVDDIVLPGMLHLALVRSPHASARIARIDLARARAATGVVGAYSLADLPELAGALPAPVMNAMPIRPYRQAALADGVVRFVGEPVVAVVAQSRHAAADGLELVDIAYEPLPAVVDVERARAPGSPLVHPPWATNVAGELEAEVGDADAAFARSDLVIERRFQIGRMGGLPLETRGVVASWDDVAGMLTVWSSTQMPYGVREYIINALELPRTGVRVIAPDVGGGFGPKGAVYGEDIIASAITRCLKAPIKWIETRNEAMMATVHGHDQIHWARLGLTRDGVLTALEDRFVIDNGAYLPRGGRTANNILAHLMGPYRFPAFRCRGEVVVTNKTPNIPFRGAGRLQATFVTERLIHEAAAALGMDPVDLKRKNLIRPDELPLDRKIPYRPGLPVVYDSGDYPALLERAVDMIGYRAFRAAQKQERADGRLIGCAVALYTEGTGVPPAEGAMITVSERGHVNVAVGAASQGQGHETTLAQLCAEQLGISPAQVTVVAGDTARFPASPVSSGTFASRIAAISGPAIVLAVEEVKAKARNVASRMLECDPADLVMKNGRVHVAGVEGAGLSLAEVAAAARGVEFLGEHAEPGLSATRYYLPPAVTWAAGAHAAFVEVCPETGAVRVLRYVVAHDAGREINPQIVEGQAHGGVAQGLGSALLEEMVYDQAGQLLTGSFMDYALPRADDVPALEVSSVSCRSTVNALGIKGAGEGGAIPGQALIANAVADALGRDGAAVNIMPLRPERIRKLMNGSTGGSDAEQA